MENLSNRQAATPVILGLAVLSLVWYLFLLLNPENIGQPVAYGLLVTAEVIGMIQLLGFWLSIIVGKPDKTPYEVIAVKNVLIRNPKLAGTVAVFVPVSGEPIEVIAETLRAARDIRFPHGTWVLDDGKSDAVKALASELGVHYLRRADRKGWKAGNINHALERVPCDYFAIFDSDHVAHPEFLHETLPWMLADKKMAFVQTPQYLVNRRGFVAGGMAETQELFYRHLQTAKNHFNAAFCVGTNVLFRADAVFEVGGIYDKSHTEDIWTSYLLHEAGWNSKYLSTVLATGQAPETVESFLRQQYRWATGGYELLFKKNPLFSRSLTLDQKLQYLHTAMFFLSGFSVFIFFLLPLLYVYFGWKPLSIPDGGLYWAAHFLPYLFLMFLTGAHLLGRWPRWRTYVMAVGAFPAHMGACLGVLTGIHIRWSASGVVRSNIDYVKSVMLHLLLLFLSVGAIPVLMLTERSASVGLLLSVWLLWNSALLFELCRRAIPSRDRAMATSSANTAMLSAPVAQ